MQAVRHAKYFVSGKMFLHGTYYWTVINENLELCCKKGSFKVQFKTALLENPTNLHKINQENEWNRTV
jgi:hypothetical protein